MATDKDPILGSLGTANLGSPKALLGSRGGPMVREFRGFGLHGTDILMARIGLLTGKF
jgi:hypothetical protein